MGILDNAIAKRYAALSTIGRAALNVQYPKEFEYYMVALELMDANRNTIQYFIFPIMPTSMLEILPEITNTRKTAGGVTVVSSSQFIPTNITLSGNFGRKFKILLGQNGQNAQDLVQSIKLSDVTAKNIENVFDTRVKTGYGCIKVLQDILAGAKVIDPQGPRYLVLYNLASGNNYFIKPGDLSLSMTMESNMIWNYSLPIKSVAPLGNFLSQDDLQATTKQLIMTDLLQKETNKLLSSLTTIVSQTQDKLSTVL